MAKRQNVKTSKEPAARELVPLLGYQRRAVMSDAQFTHNNWSRQTGKSFAFALRRVLRGMSRNRTQILLSASERQSRELMSKVRLHLKALIASVDGTMEDLPDSQFEGTKFAQLETRVRHRTNAFDFRIIALPANAQTCRGYTGDVLLDEFAMHRDDVAIWAAIYPVAMRGAGEIDICSTPRGRKNMFYRLAGNERFAASRVTIHDAVAAGLKVDAESLRIGLGDDLLWSQEFLCEFLDEATAFLTFEQIGSIEDVQLDKTWTDDKIGAAKEYELFCGWDIGRHHDLTVFWILGRKPGETQLRTLGVVEMRRTDFEAQENFADALLAMPTLRRLCIDATGMGIPIAEDFGKRWGSTRAESVVFTPASKSDMADRLRMKVEDRSIRIPIDTAIRNDLHSIERQVLPGGGIRYAADRGKDGHADRFWALALAVRAAGDGAYVPLNFESCAPLQFGRGPSIHGNRDDGDQGGWG